MQQKYTQCAHTYDYVQDIISLIILNCAKQIQEKEILKAAQKWAIYSALQQIEALAGLIPKEESNQKQIFIEDQEPPSQKEDSWQVRPAKYQPKQIPSQKELHLMLQSVNEVRTTTYLRQKSNKQTVTHSELLDYQRPSPQILVQPKDDDQEVEFLRQRKKDYQQQENLIKEKQKLHQRQTEMELNRIKELKERLNGKYAYDYNGEIIIMKNNTKIQQMPPQVLRAIIDNQNQIKKKQETTQISNSEEDPLNLLKQKPFQELAQKVAKQQTDRHPNPQIDDYLKQYLGSQKFLIPDVPFRATNEVKETNSLIQKQTQYSFQQQVYNQTEEPQQVIVLPHLQLKPGVKLTQKIGKDFKIQEEPIPRVLQTLKKSEWDKLILSSQGSVLKEVQKYHRISTSQYINESSLQMITDEENLFKGNIDNSIQELFDINNQDIKILKDGRIIKDISQINQQQKRKQVIINSTYKKKKSESIDRGKRKLPLSRGQSGDNSFLSETSYKSAYVTKKQWRVRLNKDQNFTNNRANNSFDFYN